MQAILMREPGGPEVLRLVELDHPVIATPTQMLVRLHAAGVNPVDTKIRARGPLLPDTLTAVLGCDGAGTVEAVGTGVRRFRPGDAVWFCFGGLGGPNGNYAELVLVEEAAAQPKPKSLDFATAAAAPLVLITAWEALHERAGLRAGLHAGVHAGQQVLIHGGAGGVGHVAIQLARAAGARVATTVGNPAQAAFVHELGAEYAIDYRQEALEEAIANWTQGLGVAVALDTVGPAVLRRTIPAMAVYGDLVTLLDPGPDLDLSEARLRNLRLSLTLMLTPQLRGLPAELARQGEILRQCAALIEAGQLRIEVAETFPLARAADAHRRLAAGGHCGKFVLMIDG